jgi:deazaflavin-dependent oxidoreductase (nitroreductase family)
VSAEPRTLWSRLNIALQRLFMKAHVAIYRLTAGKVGSHVSGANPRIGERAFLLLTTTGRKSGQQRITPLFYLPDGENSIVVASNWGAATHPQWWQNLQANPHAQIQIRERIIPIIAHEADPEEHTRLWTILTARHPDFADYQRKTTRQIPLVILTPNP